MARDVDSTAGSLPFEPAPGLDEGEWEVLQPSAPVGSGPSPWLWVGGLGLAAVLVAVAVGFGAGDDGFAPAQTSLGAPSTAVASTSVVTPSVTPSGAPRYEPAERPFGTFGAGPVLGVEVGRRLVGVRQWRETWWLVELDLDTGDTRQTPLPGFAGAGGYQSGVLPLAGGAMAVWSAEAQPILVSAEGVWRPILNESYGPVMPGPDGTTLWWLDYSSAGPPVLEQVAVADGTTVASFAHPQGVEVVGPDGAGGVLVSAQGQPTWRVKPGGGVEPLPNAQGAVVAASPAVIVERRCTVDLSCSLAAHPPGTPDAVTLELAGDPDPSRSVLSPDGRRLAALVPSYNSATAELWLVDLTTGAAQLVKRDRADRRIRRMAWVGPDLLLVGDSASLKVVRVAEPDAAPVPLALSTEPLVLEPFTVVPAA
jgi:hypothetical protein